MIRGNGWVWRHSRSAGAASCDDDDDPPYESITHEFQSGSCDSIQINPG